MSILVPTMYGLPFVEMYGGSFDLFANKRAAIQRKEEMSNSKPRSGDDNREMPEGLPMTMTLGTPTIMTT